MPNPGTAAGSALGLRSREWLYSYKTSTTLIDGRPVDMLHDFYIPALRLATGYDRVAGYFRSSSLAAASQGFSAFVNHGGKMRLIVGADLEPEDVAAILAGDQERLESRLNAELAQPEQWPEDVRNGVVLLGWMVAKGYLEVKVAFRLHRETGKPIPFDSVEDGYVHEKWFIFRDEYGNRMYGSGSLNESKNALVHNAENVDIHCDWWGGTDRLRVEDAEAAFEAFWDGRVQHLRVMSIPEAVRQRLIQIAQDSPRLVEIDGTTAAEPETVAPSSLERLRFALIKDAPLLPGGRYVGLETAPVEPWPHQRMVARRLIDGWPYSYLLCDEVGLGKTIEAGLAIRSLYLSGIAKRVLIAAPASLTRQWQREMASKMLLSFGRVYTGPQTGHEYVWPDEERVPTEQLFDPDLTIVSTGLLARKDRAKGLSTSAPFDIALVDEAHYARRQNPTRGAQVHPEYGQLYKAIRDHLRPQARSLWLATATPMQIHPVEVHDLLALTERVGAFQGDPSLMEQYYDLLEKLLHDKELTSIEWQFLRRVVLALEREDPLYWQYVNEYVVDGKIRVALRKWLEHNISPRGRDCRLLLPLLFSVSPLGRVMMRHTRKLLELYRETGQLKANLATRHVLPVPRIVFSDQEKKIYKALEDYCKGLGNQLRSGTGARTGNFVRFLLSFLRLRFASSFYAIEQTLRRRLQRVEETLAQTLPEAVTEEAEEELEDWVYDLDVEDDSLATGSFLKNRSRSDLEWERNKLLDLLRELEGLSGPSSKMKEFLRHLDARRNPVTGRIRQTVVFTRFYDTLVDIVKRLRQVDPEMRIGTYSGQGCSYYDPECRRMVSADREEVKKRYLHGEVDILICTDAAAEGLNLQTADMLINFDLGWNPMKIEQRIGRIDRIGQRHTDVYVLNLCYLGSAEEIVYGRLLQRLEQANLIVGTQQISLLPVTPEEFAALEEGTLTPEELEKRAIERLQEQQRRTQRMEISPEDLYRIYMNMEKVGAGGKVPITLDAIWDCLAQSEYLKAIGCEVVGGPDAPAMRLRGIEGVPDGTLITTSRKLYEQGPDARTRVQFASYGDPVFDAVLGHLSAFELPGCARRVSIDVPGMDGVQMVAYAVAARENRMVTTRLVKSWKDLDGLELAEEVTLSPEAVEAVRAELKQMAEAEYQAYRVAYRIRRDNLLAARAHEVLELLAIWALLRDRARFAAEGTLFGSVIKEVEDLFAEREVIQAAQLPAGLLRPLAPYFLFDVKIPRMGEDASVAVPRILAHAAINAARRVVDGAKIKKTEQYIGAMLSRIYRQAEEKFRQAMKA
ncbi:MAG TPA: helicase-related protein [Symbiobacteriaceae bacterium]